MTHIQKLIGTNERVSTVLIRCLVGLVFLSEGLQKFITPEKTGVGRFAKIGFENPEIMATFVGINEILFGLALIMGILTRLSVIPIIVIMLTALTTTKIPIFQAEGFWAAAHAARTDLSMLTCSIFLLIEGAGPLSLDKAVDKILGQKLSLWLKK